MGPKVRLKAAVDAANVIINAARKDNRPFTDDERKALAKHEHDADTAAAEIEAAKGDEALLARLSGHGAAADYQGREDSGFDRDAVKAGLVGAVHRKGSFGFDMPLRKAAITAGDQDLPASGTEAFPAAPGDSVVALRDLLDLRPNSPAVVRYYRIGLGSGADVVPEGGLKPELVAGITPVDAALANLAVRFNYTDELIEDADFLVNYVQAEAVRAVLRRENQLIVADWEAATGTLTSTGTLADALDVLAGAIGAAEATNGLTPSRIVANPLDLATIRTQKSSGSGEYRIDPLSGQPTAIHGVPVQATPAVAAGRLYLVTPGVGVFYTRGALRVEAGYSGDDWNHNRVTTRVEERVLPALVRPSLLTKVTLTTE